jgi:hypothetical protein
MSTEQDKEPDYEERDILITLYVYDHDTEAVNVDVKSNDLNCSFFSTCELVKRVIILGTDAKATDAECVERFIGALKESGMNIGMFEYARGLATEALAGVRK